MRIERDCGVVGTREMSLIVIDRELELWCVTRGLQDEIVTPVFGGQGTASRETVASKELAGIHAPWSDQPDAVGLNAFVV